MALVQLVLLILLLIKGAEKIGKICLILPPMRGSHPGTLLPSRGKLKVNNNSVYTNTAPLLLPSLTIAGHTNRELGYRLL